MQSLTAIKAWKSGSLFFENYHYATGTHQPPEAHSHPEYQIGLAINALGRYVIRGNSLNIPQLNLSIIHSGETHQPDASRNITVPCAYLMMYVSPEVMLSAGREIGWWKENELPHFGKIVFDDKELVRRYLLLYRFSKLNTDRLANDIQQLEFLTFLIKNFSQASDLRIGNSSQKAIKQVREYLDAHFKQQISLDELAWLTGMSKYYLCRKFAEKVGVPPHVYQYQLRLNAAKKMLVQKRPVAEIAHELGFYDQSHFGKYFKKFSGFSPRVYSRGAIFS